MPPGAVHVDPAPGAWLAAVASAMPPHRVGTRAVVDGLRRLFPEEDPAFVSRVVERSGVEQRHFAVAPEELLRPAGFTERNSAFQPAALELAACAARRALERAGLAAAEVDVVIDVSCTGISIPALDVDLAPALGLRADALRLPVTESGCAGGALALGLAARLSRLGQRVLVVAVELCSLTLVHGDRSRTNLVASVLFGDGAAAAVVLPRPGWPAIRAQGSHLFPETRQAMGFAIGSDGLRIVLQRELPELLRCELRPVVERFLQREGLEPAQIGLHLVHPGGRAVLDVYGELFGLQPAQLHCSREALRRFGNLSSVSILTVLEIAMQGEPRPGRSPHALALAFGPGLSVEMLLLGWDGPAP